MSAPNEAFSPPAEEWRVIGASVIGTNHERAGVPCQDAHRWAVLPDGSLIVAVADGAGSAACAEKGARRAVEMAVAHLVEHLPHAAPTDAREWREAMQAAMEAARAAIIAHAMCTDTPVRKYATTLTLVVVTAQQCVVSQIGDGAAILESEGDLLLAVPPQRGEYANEVALLTMPDAVAHAVHVLFTHAVHAVAVTTDGLLRLAMQLPSYEPHAPFFRPLLAFLRETDDPVAATDELAAFLASERVTARTDDDKTLVLAVRDPADDATNPTLPPPTETPDTE